MANYAKPTEAARAFKIAGANPNGLRRARQIVQQRSFTYDPQPVTCITCGSPRDRRSYPVCDGCSARRKEGVR